jgi:hypothetical protein
MSNHDGGYLLNYVLHRLAENGLVERLGKRKVQAIVIDIVTVAEKKHDCNSGEILDHLGKQFGVCASCLKPAKEIKSDVCPQCWEEIGLEEEEEEESWVNEPYVMPKWLDDAMNKAQEQRKRRGK